MAGIGSLLKGATKGAKAIQEAAEASKLAPPRLNWSADNLDAIGAIPNVYDFINNPGYQLREKDRQIEIVMMSPDEYINEAARILSSGSSESTAADVIQQRARNLPRIQGIQDLLDQGEDFQIPFLDYKGGGQEGLHRAMAAKNLGEESIPVMIMRSARGEDRVPLPKKAQDMAVGGAVSSAAKAIRRLVEAGFPESTAEKIVMGDLPMDTASRMARAREQGFDPGQIRYHATDDVFGAFDDAYLGQVTSANAIDFDEGSWANNLAMLGHWTSDRPLAEAIGAERSMPLVLRGQRQDFDSLDELSDAITNAGGVKAFQDDLLSEGFGGVNVRDEEFGGLSQVTFRPQDIRSPEAAFDPDQTGSSNILAGLGPAAVGAGLLGAAMAPKEAEAAPFGTLARMLGKRTQETFHGSPHIFDQVDMSRMGSGEGTQFEGAGFYSAGARPTAESYQRDLSGYYGGSDVVEQRAYSDLFDLAEEYAGDRDPEDVLDEIMSSIADQDYDRLPLELQGPAREIEARSRGALYRTEIPAEDLLDWDAPLAEQPEAIRSAVMDTARAAKADAANPDAIDLEALPGMTGGDAYEQLRAVYGNGASAELNNRGVLGVQYLDAASREAGEGTRNYVVFDEANVNVVERNGEPIAALPRGRTAAGVAGLIGAGLMAPEEAEAAPFGSLARAIGRGTLRAYTGSAAKYATPSIQRVGTGEGNQAFGYGLYFSDSPQIAGGYRRGVSGGKVLDRMSDRYFLDDLDLQSVDEMIDLGEFAVEDEKLMRALRDADYLGFDRPMDAVRTVFSPDINAFDPADPAVQKLQKIADEVGFLYEVEVPSENFIDWNLTLEEQPEVVQQVVRQNAQDPRIRDKIDAGSFRGSDAYYLFGNNPEVNSMMWAQYGVPGVRYNSFGRTIRGLDDARARKDAPQNYVIFDENLINIVRRNDEALENNFDERAAQAAALDVRKPLAAILAAGAAGATQAGQDEVPDYMRRLDGSIKSERGFLGPIQNKVSGRTMTEVSIGQPGSEEGFYPLLVPTLTQEEIDTIANLDLERERPPMAIIEKARAHAMDRINRGLSPFYQDGEDGSFGEYDARTAQRLGQELDRLMQLAEIRRQPSIVPLQDTAMARVGDYLLEDRPSEMDTLQRALQRLDMGQGLGDYLQTTGQGDQTTMMQNLMAGLDIFDILGLLPGAGKASSAAVRAAQRGN